MDSISETYMKDDAWSHRYYLVNPEGSSIYGYAKVQVGQISFPTAAEESKFLSKKIKIVDSEG